MNGFLYFCGGCVLYRFVWNEIPRDSADYGRHRRPNLGPNAAYGIVNQKIVTTIILETNKNPECGTSGYGYLLVEWGFGVLTLCSLSLESLSARQLFPTFLFAN